MARLKWPSHLGLLADVKGASYWFSTFSTGWSRTLTHLLHTSYTPPKMLLPYGGRPLPSSSPREGAPSPGVRETSPMPCGHSCPIVDEGRPCASATPVNRIRVASCSYVLLRQHAACYAIRALVLQQCSYTAATAVRSSRTAAPGALYVAASTAPQHRGRPSKTGLLSS